MLTRIVQVRTSAAIRNVEELRAVVRLLPDLGEIETLLLLTVKPGSCPGCVLSDVTLVHSETWLLSWVCSDTLLLFTVKPGSCPTRPDGPWMLLLFTVKPGSCPGETWLLSYSARWSLGVLLADAVLMLTAEEDSSAATIAVVLSPA
uniref:Uncharacterized protein n=1 Tax=Timema shepardi TaxID=629360 RepID=A0A7R9G7K4_TIMSH|nr:unnamed protein product [Timema shepardi]